MKATNTKDTMRWYEDGTLRFALGIEDTFIPQTMPGEKPLDEYELTQHYHFWHEDLGHAAEAAATMVRWGIPWYRVNPEPGKWDFSWVDRVVDRFEELGLEPIVDLMHYGTPTWLDNQFLNTNYPERMAEYAAKVAERYRGRLVHYTPLNEPLLNAIYCGEFGYWPPYLSGDDGLVQLVRAISKGIVLSQRAIDEITAGQSDFVHVEASFRFAGDVEAFPERVEHLRNRAYLIEDLVNGMVTGEHPLARYLALNGFNDNDLAWAMENTAVPDVMGVNYYPALSTEAFEKGVSHTGGPNDFRPRVNAWTEGLEEVLTSFAARYGRPVFLTETCWTGTVEQRITWLDASVETVRELRDRGVDVVGYTWWAVIDMIEWTYRHGNSEPMAYHLPMGLWNLEEDAAGILRRVQNPVADRFRQHALDPRNNEALVKVAVS
jgi:beta-glucosidase/6-phospho-beta-glucosidase/beta-galactosidase